MNHGIYMGFYMLVHHSQHTQSLQASEHPASDRVNLIGGEVEFDDGRRAFKCPVFNVSDLVVAEVTEGRSTTENYAHEKDC